MGKRRISDETAAVLELFLAEPGRARYGREIILETELKSGSLHPMLRRLDDRGVLASEWEDATRAFELGRRPRRLYRLRGDRIEEAESMLSKWRSSHSAPRTTGKVRPA